jgi:hypothetical protein
MSVSPNLSLISMGRNTKWIPIFLYILIGIAVIAMLYYFSLISQSVSSSNTFFLRQIANSNIKMHYFKQATIKSSIPNAAYAFLALGAQANQINCIAAIESLIKFTGWDGPVYMLTDREECFDIPTIVKHTTIDPKKFHIAVVDDMDFSSGGFDFSKPKVGFLKNRIKSKSMKARIFDYVKDPDIKVIAYVDCDILFGIEGCATRFISESVGDYKYPSWNDYSFRFSRIFRDNSSHLTGVHAGEFVIHRDHSKAALAHWVHEIENGLNITSDQDGFIKAYNRVERARLNAGINNTQAVLSTRHPMEPTAIWDPVSKDVYEKFFYADRDELPCMLHVTKSRCKSLGRKVVQDRVMRYNLSVYYDGRYQYCPHPYLFTFLYGWFPLRFIPFCPKAEYLM